MGVRSGRNYILHVVHHFAAMPESLKTQLQNLVARKWCLRLKGSDILRWRILLPVDEFWLARQAM